jgi:hypothetical protein
MQTDRNNDKNCGISELLTLENRTKYLSLEFVTPGFRSSRFYTSQPAHATSETKTAHFLIFISHDYLNGPSHRT